jgi:hypothetical protein
MEAVEETDAVWLGLIRKVSDAVGVPVLEGVLLAVMDAVAVLVPVPVSVEVLVSEPVPDGVAVSVTVLVAVDVWEAVMDAVLDTVGVPVPVPVPVPVSEGVGVEEGVCACTAAGCSAMQRKQERPSFSNGLTYRRDGGAGAGRERHIVAREYACRLGAVEVADACWGSGKVDVEVNHCRAREVIVDGVLATLFDVSGHNGAEEKCEAAVGRPELYHRRARAGVKQLRRRGGDGGQCENATQRHSRGHRA